MPAPENQSSNITSSNAHNNGDNNNQSSNVHVNPNASTANFASTHRDAQDPQVAQIIHDAPLPTLCDVICEELLDGRDPVRPTISRLVLVGELPSKDDPPRVFFDDCAQTAMKRVNAMDPTGGKGSSIADPMNIAGLFFELPGHFVQVVESEPAHLLEYTRELHARCVLKKSDGVNKVHVIMYLDDVVHRSCAKLFYVEVPPSVTGGQIPEGVPLENLIVEQVHKMLQLLQLAQNQSKLQVDNFLANAKNQQAQLIPKTPFAEKCISSGYCLTLDEYVQLFGSAPNVVRASEVLHPVEDPLPHGL